MPWTLVSPNGTASAGNTTSGASGDVVITKPAGVANGHLMVVNIYAEPDTNTFDTVPSGWSAVGGIANTGAFKLWQYWKIADSEPSSWTWSLTTGSQWYEATFAAFTGGSGSGAFVDVAGTGAQADGALTGSQTAPSVTTTANNSLVVFCYGNFSGSNVSTLTGFATNLAISFGGCTIAYATQGTAGATGTTNPTGMGSEDYAAIHIAFLETGAGGGGGGTRFILGTH